MREVWICCCTDQSRQCCAQIRGDVAAGNLTRCCRARPLQSDGHCFTGTRLDNIEVQSVSRRGKNSKAERKDADCGPLDAGSLPHPAATKVVIARPRLPIVRPLRVSSRPVKRRRRAGDDFGQHTNQTSVSTGDESHRAPGCSRDDLLQLHQTVAGRKRKSRAKVRLLSASLLP